MKKRVMALFLSLAMLASNCTVALAGEEFTDTADAVVSAAASSIEANSSAENWPEENGAVETMSGENSAAESQDFSSDLFTDEEQSIEPETETPVQDETENSQGDEIDVVPEETADSQDDPSNVEIAPVESEEAESDDADQVTPELSVPEPVEDTFVDASGNSFACLDFYGTWKGSYTGLDNGNYVQRSITLSIDYCSMKGKIEGIAEIDNGAIYFFDGNIDFSTGKISFKGTDFYQDPGNFSFSEYSGTVNSSVSKIEGVVDNTKDRSFTLTKTSSSYKTYRVTRYSVAKDWSGEYDGRSGDTVVKRNYGIHISSIDNSGAISGTATITPSSKANASYGANGSYKFKGTIDFRRGKISLQGYEWIDYPADYSNFSFVKLTGFINNQEHKIIGTSENGVWEMQTSASVNDVVITLPASASGTVGKYLSVKANITSKTFVPSDKNLTWKVTTANGSAAQFSYGDSIEETNSTGNYSITKTFKFSKAGTYTLKVTASTGASDTCKITVASSASKPQALTVSLGQSSYTYDGKAKKPGVTVKYGTKTLKNGTDYSVSYSNYVSAGTASVKVTGKGTYKGNSKTVTYTIKRKDISNFSFTLSTTSYICNGTARKPSVTVKWGKIRLWRNVHYNVSYKDNIYTGVATVTVTGIDNYTGTKKLYFFIKSPFKIIIKNANNLYYTGKPVRPEVTVKYGSKTLLRERAYTIGYSNNVHAGNAAHVVIKGAGLYKKYGTVYTSFTIKPKSLNSSSMTVKVSQDPDTIEYTGSAVEPAVQVTDNSLKKNLAFEDDFTLYYSNNVKVGKNAQVKVQGLGNYTGSVTLKFEIVENWDSKVGKTLADISSNYYTKGNMLYNAGYKGQCTWYAYGRFYEQTGIALKMARNAKYWLSDNASDSRVKIVYNIQDKCIAVRTAGSFGHVMFIEHVTYNSKGTPEYVYFTECNWDSNSRYDAGKDAVVIKMKYSDFLSKRRPMGYIAKA